MSCTDKTLKVYLAGKMSGLDFDEMNAWREEIKKKLEDIADMKEYKAVVINPVDFYNFEVQRHQSEKEVKDFDLHHATTSDIIIVNLVGLGTSDGTKIELHDCNFHNSIPVIAFGEKALYDDLHPWVRDNITRHEQNVDSVVAYIRDFYMF